MKEQGNHPHENLEAQAVFERLANTGEVIEGTGTKLNRAQRRKLKREGEKSVKKVVDNHEDKLKELEKPITAAEAIQIATAVSQDMINNYHKQANPLMVGVSLQLEIMKTHLIKNNFITEEDFDKEFEVAVENFNNMRSEMMKQANEESVSEEVPEDLDQLGKSQDA